MRRGLPALGLGVRPSTRHLIVDADGGWEVVGGPGKPTRSAHTPASHPLPPLPPAPQSLDRGEPLPISTGWETCFQRVTSERTFSDYWSPLLIGRCLHSPELPRTQTGGLGGGLWAVPCLSAQDLRLGEMPGTQAQANGSPHLAGPRALAPPGHAGQSFRRDNGAFTCTYDLPTSGAESVKTLPGADSAISACIHGDMTPSGGAQPSLPLSPARRGGTYAPHLIPGVTGIRCPCSGHAR